MNTILTNLRLPAKVGFLIILPFMFLEFIFVVVKRLNFDVRDALDSVVVFGSLWLGVAGILLILLPLVRNLRAGNTFMANRVLTEGNTLLTTPKTNAVIGLILALPFVTISSLILLQIEPPLGPLEPLVNNPDTDQPDTLRSLVVLGAYLLTIAGCIIARAPIVRTMRTGGSPFAHPINLILAAVILVFIALFVVGLILDQYPCWIGVPNCD